MNPINNRVPNFNLLQKTQIEKQDKNEKTDAAQETSLETPEDDNAQKRDITRDDLTVMWNLFMEYGCGKNLIAVNNYMCSQIENYIRENNINVDANELVSYFVQTFDNMQGHGAIESAYILEQAMNDFVTSHSSNNDKNEDNNNVITKYTRNNSEKYVAVVDSIQQYQGDLAKASIHVNKSLRTFQ